ncbi:MAG: M20 family metallopeptidase [Kiritimatiellia bacterium]
MSLDAVHLLAELVACPSTTPRRAAPSAEYPAETNLQKQLEGHLRAMGARTTYEEVLPGRSNLLAVFQGRDTSRTLLLAAHADTVPQDGMTIPPFQPDIRDGRLYGRGSTDCKGGMAAMLAALSRVLEKRDGLPCNVAFVATCNEEYGADGAKAFMKRHAGEFFGAVVAEPTELEIVHFHKGVLRFAIETRGVPAHTSMPERGASAVFAMCDVIGRIEGPLRETLARRIHPVLGAPRITVGVIQGGTQVNIVPDRCRIEVDRRTLPGETAASVQAELEEILVAARRAADPRIVFSCQPTEDYPPLAEPAEGPLCRLAIEACRRTLGRGTLASAPFATDGGVFQSLGLPSIILGPGSIQQAHTQDEFIEIAAVRQAADVFETLIGLAGPHTESSEAP